MTTMQKFLPAGLAAVALAAYAVVAQAAPYPDVDFEWYANVGRPAGSEVMPAPRDGYIWAPGHYEWTGTRQVWAPGVWVRDEQSPRWTAFRSGPNTTTYTTGPLELRDSQGNVIPVDPAAYPVGSAR